MVRGYGHPYGYSRPVAIYLEIHSDVRVELSVPRTVRQGCFNAKSSHSETGYRKRHLLSLQCRTKYLTWGRRLFNSEIPESAKRPRYEERHKPLVSLRRDRRLNSNNFSNKERQRERVSCGFDIVACHRVPKLDRE